MVDCIPTEPISEELYFPEWLLCLVKGYFTNLKWKLK